jgi:hypothetical protein
VIDVGDDGEIARQFCGHSVGGGDGGLGNPMCSAVWGRGQTRNRRGELGRVENVTRSCTRRPGIPSFNTT